MPARPPAGATGLPLLRSHKWRLLVAHGVALLPLQSLRLALYRLLFGYQFGPGTTLAHGVVIAVHAFACGRGVVIRRGNRFIGPIRVELGDHAFIGLDNLIECGEAAGRASAAAKGYARHFRLGRECLIHEGHRFDVYGLIDIGDGTWVAGFGSQFLTHGASTPKRDIRIGKRCYLGSAVRFAPGAGLGDEVMLGMGAVVSRHLPDSSVVVAGVPAKVLRPRTDEDTYHFERNW